VAESLVEAAEIRRLTRQRTRTGRGMLFRDASCRVNRPISAAPTSDSTIFPRPTSSCRALRQEAHNRYQRRRQEPRRPRHRCHLCRCLLRCHQPHPLGLSLQPHRKTSYVVRRLRDRSLRIPEVPSAFDAAKAMLSLCETDEEKRVYRQAMVDFLHACWCS
jgi:hypothetical protein